MSMTRDALRRLALSGAQSRLRELESERAALLKEFPELETSSRRRTTNAVSATPRGSRKKRKLSKAQRRAISDRMSALWARRRQAKRKAA